jgi:YidC/Oxa1 family membrane protein insertase
VIEEEPAQDAPGVLQAVTFRFVTPDKKFEVRKRYSVEKVDVPNNPREARDTTPGGYELRLELTVKNLGQQTEQVSYVLQGPVGVPLENVDNTRKFRDVKVGFLEEDGRTDDDSITAADIVKDEDEVWKRAFKYVGVDVQYFAALILPDDDRPLEQQVADPHIASIEQVVVAPAGQPERSDVSVLLTSDVFALAAGEELTHAYTLYAGPKRQELLEPEGAAAVLDYGWFGPVAKAMLWLLKTMHNNAGIPYGVAIILMTILVRGCMFPLSLKQARGAKKMKELQPKIAELRKKYEKDKEKLARAQMELFSKHNYNPLAGCLPIFLQLPIFIGLYTALNSSVDLRMAPFLWIDNLAGPDALFRMPFSLPFLGQDFNLLPIITVILFVIQQKMFMPPPTDEQQEMQQKMMMWMSIIFGFFFYHLPAGLCVYFIASSLWGFGERKLLDLGMFAEASTEPEAADAERPAKPADAPKRAKTGWWNRLLESADAAASDAGGTSGQGRLSKQLNGAKDKRKKSRPR